MCCVLCQPNPCPVVSLLQARLCPPLRIELAPKEEESYDDLDEVVARWVAAGEQHVVLCINGHNMGIGW